MQALRLAAAYAMDWIVGDPHWFPHPVRLMGLAISTGEGWLRGRSRQPAAEIVLGEVLTAAVVASSWAGARFAIAAANRMNRRSGAAVEIIFAWTTLATGSLIDEAGAVIDALDAGQIDEARRRLAMIVGRDTEHLDETEIARAVIETVAEGLCDGIVAPLVYLAIGGVPLAFAYKAANTLDSMIGHREPPYRYFGRFAARLDDAANLVPARLSAIAIVLAAAITSYDGRRAFRTWIGDGHKHPSPNAGQSEAAMAGALGVRLGGMNCYAGIPSPKPYLGESGRASTSQDARASLRTVRAASLLACVAAVVFCVWKDRR